VFLHVSYEWWLVGWQQRYIETINQRCKTWITCWRPCEMRSKDGVPSIVCVLLYKLMHMFYSVSSPYLLVFGDDRVRGTREQSMLQVDLVRHRVEAVLVGRGHSQSFIFYEFLKNL